MITPRHPGVPESVIGRIPMRAGVPMSLVGFKTRWTITYAPDLRSTVKRTPRLAKQANMEAVKYWHSDVLPRHFELQAVNLYDYQKRTRYTQMNKAKKHGHQQPIKAKGIAESMLELQARFSSTSKSAQVTMRGPQWIAFRTRREDGKLSPDLKEELVIVTQQEALELAAVAKKAFSAAMDREPAPTTTKTFGG